MKYILIFLFALLCSVGYAQNPVSQYLGSPTTTVISRGALKADSSLILPQFPDTIAANRSPYIKFYPGNLIRVFNDIYMRNTTATAWQLINGGGTGGNNFIDSLRKVGDSVFARKYGVFVYQYTDSAQNILANNGLSFSGDTLQLGGTLTKNTTINADSNEVRIDTVHKFIVTNELGLNHIYTDSTINRLDVKSAFPGEQNQLQLYLGDRIDYEPQRQSQINLSTTADDKSANLQLDNYEGISLSAFGGGNQSNFKLSKDSITISPNDSIINISKIKTNADTANYLPLMWNPNVKRLEAYTGGFTGLAPNLQQVTDKGNTTTNNIIINDSLNGETGIDLYDGANASYVQIRTIDGGIKFTNTYSSSDFAHIYGNNQGRTQLKLGINSLGTTGVIKNNFITSSKNYELPNNSGTFALSVNNNYADSAGNITIPTIDTNSLRRVKYVGLTMPSAFNLTGSPITDSGTIAVTGAGTASQYVRGDGVLASFPTAATGGGASVSYYLNGSVNKGTFGGETYYEMSRTAIIGAGTDFTRTNAQGDGLVAQFITDTITNLLIPAGNWNLELYFNASSGGGTPSFYVELYKYDGTNFTLISSNSTSPELIAFGTTINPYFSALAVPETILSGTDRLAIRVFVNTSGRSITLHTENSHLCQIITTFTTGLTAINGLTKQVQYFATGTSGTDFNISSSNDTHTFNLPTASATNRGALSSTDWSTFNSKLGSSDTISLSNRINTKLNISDTSAMLSPYLRSIDTTNKYVTSVFRKTASDSVFFVRGGSNNFAFRDSAGGGNIYNTDGTLTGNRTVTMGSNTLSFTGNLLVNGLNVGKGNNNIASNTAFGVSALNGNAGTITGTNNTVVGNNSGNNVRTGSDNTVLGSVSFQSNQTGIRNVAIGSGSLQGTTGNFNIGIGYFAGGAGDNNTGVGSNSLFLSTGGSNAGFGYFSGRYNTTGTNQIFLNSLDRTNYSGDQTGSPFYAQQNSTVTSQIVTLNGRVGINTISPSSSAALAISSTTQGFLRPTMTNTQMNAISTPATGLSVFNTTDSLEYVYRGASSGWQKNVTYTRTNDIGLLNGADQRLMIEPTTNIVAGRTLTVEAGSTQAGGTSAFQGLSQTARAWYFIKAAPNGDVYATTETSGDIYKRTGGTGNFVALGQTSRAWLGIAVQSNGDVFIAVNNGFIYKQTGGTGNFTAVHSTSRAWRGMAAASNNDLYACVDNGDIYKSTDNGVTFTGLGQTSRQWRGITVAPNGDIYAVVVFGDIWKSTNGGTTFTALNATGIARAWLDITTTSNGDIYATVLGGDIWKSTNGGTTFTALNQTARNWSGIGAAPNGDIYATAGVNTTSDIFLQSAGTANLNGGTLVLQSGVGKGTGTSTINFNTGTTLTSGATLQTASTKMTILGNGNVGIGTTSPSAKLELSDTARGFLQTRMTTTQMNAIVSPSVGLQVFNTTDSSNYVYRGSGGGWQRLATGSVSSVTQQTYTSGASVTCNDNTTWLIIDPATLQSTLTVNLPSVPSPNQDVLISFGGTLTTGVVVNTLTISPTPLQSTTPSFIEVGESVGYRWNATNSKWYRVN